MIYHSKEVEESGILTIAQNMCVAARTAPKTRGIDFLDTCIITGDEKELLAVKMENLADTLEMAFFVRDADCVRKSQAVVLVGSRYTQRGLNEGCQYCNFTNCKDCADHNGVCVYDPIDLGIALSSAVSIAGAAYADSRIMFSVGKAALDLNFLDDSIKIIMGIPISATGKSPYFDRS
ncbi:MAG: DUF2148 domain-containing protein [Eubacterium sp.]